MQAIGNLEACETSLYLIWRGLKTLNGLELSASHPQSNSEVYNCDFNAVTRRTLIAWLVAAPIGLPAKDRSWKNGQLTAVEMRDFMTGKNHNLIEHRYICTISDGEYSYVVEYEKPLKLAVHDSMKFIIEKDNLIILDADGKERSARIEKRERVQPPGGDHGQKGLL